MPRERQSEDRQQTGQHDKQCTNLKCEKCERSDHFEETARGPGESHHQQQQKDSDQLFFPFWKALVTEHGTKKSKYLNTENKDFNFFCKLGFVSNPKISTLTRN